MQRREIPPGQASAFIEAGRSRTLGAGPTNNRPKGGMPNFANMTEDEYRDILKTGGASDHFIEAELKKLRVYKKRVDTEGVRKARLRMRAKQSETAQEDLGEYFSAGERMEDRLRSKKDKELHDGT